MSGRNSDHQIFPTFATTFACAVRHCLLYLALLSGTPARDLCGVTVARTPKHVDQHAVNADLRTRFGDTVTRAQLFAYRDETGIYPIWIRRDEANRLSRGLYRVPTSAHASTPVKAKAPAAAAAPLVKRVETVSPAVPAEPVSTPAPMSGLSAEMLQNADVFTRMQALRDQASLLATVPKRAPEFVPFGDFDMVRTVVASRKFFPVFITGLSGNGKTFQVEQACALTGREYIRCNITTETDEDDLLGGFRLINGNTVFEMGPVVVAMLRGAVLLLDEVDLSSAKTMCLQPVLEGKSLTLKKLGITIAPAPGFTIFATANTKGRGDADGRFVGANYLNEAFLDRFSATIEQEYPSVAVEKKILAKTFEAEGFEMTAHAATFFDTLARWAEAIRSTYEAGGIEDLIATRRLIHIVKAYGLFNGDDERAIRYCINRFDPRVKEAFVDLYNKLAPDAAAPTNVGAVSE